MTVRLIDRSETNATFLVQDKAYGLYAHGVKFCSNEKNIPKRYRWAVAYRIVETSASISKEIDVANAIRNNVSKELCVLRRGHQETALGFCSALLTELHLANSVHRFSQDGKKLAHWVELVDELMNLIKKWIESDAKHVPSC